MYLKLLVSVLCARTEERCCSAICAPNAAYLTCKGATPLKRVQFPDMVTSYKVKAGLVKLTPKGKKAECDKKGVSPTTLLVYSVKET